MSEPVLDRERLREAFDLLAEKLGRRGVVGELHVFGGASTEHGLVRHERERARGRESSGVSRKSSVAMVLAFDARTATRDVDALFEPHGPVIDSAREVAEELGLPRSWLNDQASSYVSGRAGRGRPVYDHAHLRVMTTPPEHLLAMKVRAARATRDAEDIDLLLDELELGTVAEVTAIVARFFPNEPLSDRSRLLLEDLIAARNPDASGS